MKDLRAEYDSWHRDHPTGEGQWYQLVWSALADGALLPDARVLEIGCGGGNFASRMAEHGARVVIGQDFAPEAIATAQHRFRRENLNYEVGDIEDIHYPTGHFDVIVSCETVEHVPNPRKAIAELARVLSPAGTLLLTTPNYMSITGLHRAYRNATGRKWDEGGQPLVHWTMLPRTIRWLRSSGLTVDRIAGIGWYVPVRGRPGGYAWNPPNWSRPMLTPFALHQLVVARHTPNRPRSLRPQHAMRVGQ